MCPPHHLRIFEMSVKFTNLNFEHDRVSFVALAAFSHAELMAEMETRYGFRLLGTSNEPDHMYLIDVNSSFNFNGIECTIPDLWANVFVGDDIVTHNQVTIEFTLLADSNCVASSAIHFKDGAIGYNEEFINALHAAINDAVLAGLINICDAEIDIDHTHVYFNCDWTLINRAARLLCFPDWDDTQETLKLISTDDLMVVKHGRFSFISIYRADIPREMVQSDQYGRIDIGDRKYMCYTLRVCGRVVLAILDYDNGSKTYDLRSNSIVGAMYAATMMDDGRLVETIMSVSCASQRMSYLTK